MKRAHVVVHGAVQGIFFRVETRDRARSLGVVGWVRNTVGGSVEAVFEGEDEHVESMVSWCSRGPSGARVDHVDVTWDEPQGDDDFSIR